MPKRRSKQFLEDFKKEEEQRVFLTIAFILALVFLFGRQCGENGMKETVEALQKKIAAVEQRMTNIEYPGETRYVWPSEKKRRAGDKGKR